MRKSKKEKEIEAIYKEILMGIVAQKIGRITEREFEIYVKTIIRKLMGE